jgi:hypothetical protein
MRHEDYGNFSVPIGQRACRRRTKDNPLRLILTSLVAGWFSFVRIHKTLRTSPAMAAGIETRLWSMEDVIRLIEQREDLQSGALLIG